MKLSYAQNLEDYVLEQFFAGVDRGHYVDVGGGHPVADNVSFWFYLKGWHGLVVEPQEKLANAYACVRPRDAVIAHLAGRTSSEIDFHVVEGLHGLSSANIENAASASQYGAVYKTIRRRVRPLSDLIDDAGLTAIQFLKIDVEGAEADVIAGLDLKRHRPEVILVEAVNPNAKDDHWKPWDATLQSSGYVFAFFDNLNRYYVADERKAALLPRFPKAPLAWETAAHLWDCGRAADRNDHPDRAISDVLVAGLMANLTTLPPDMLRRLVAAGLDATSKDPAAALAKLVGTAEWPRAGETPAADLDALITSDRIRAALGRIASMYDGGHLLE